MGDRTDPTELAADDGTDLHGIATWEPRSFVDRILVRYSSAAIRAAIVLFALLLLGGILLLFVVQVASEPARLLVVVLLPVSVIPALVLVGYVWYHDITTEPILPVVVTFLLGIVLASFPFFINTLTGALFAPLREIAILFLLAQILQFFLVVAPVEEVVKLGAVFVYAYGKDDFDTVIDGAVYGAIAGLGFATIENASYIIGNIGGGATTPVEFLVQAGTITTSRSFAGPGHVIWTAISGYYLGLGKFNREYALPLVIKGLFIAVVIHAVYNTTVTLLGAFGIALFSPLIGQAISLTVVVLFHLVVGAYLVWKLRRYRSTYAEVSPGPDPAPVSELDAGDGGTGPGTGEGGRSGGSGSGPGATGSGGTTGSAPASGGETGDDSGFEWADRAPDDDDRPRNE